MPVVELEANIEIVVVLGNANNVEAFQLERRDLMPLIQHMPPGKAWSVFGETVLNALLTGLARCFGRINVLERLVIRQFDPMTATFGLADWERVLALDGGEMDLADRRAAVISAVRARGGQSIPYWMELLKSFGYSNVEITPLENRFRCGDRIRKRIQNNYWAFAFRISADSIPNLDEAMMARVRGGVRATVYVDFNLT